MTNLPEFTKLLPRNQSKVFEILFRAMPEFVETEKLIDTLYADDLDGGPEYARNCVATFISKLRPRLPSGWEIVSGWGRGYRLVQPPQAVPTTDISSLKAIIGKAEEKIGLAQETLTLSAAGLAQVVGPLAAAHRLAELALEMADLAEMEAGNG